MANLVWLGDSNFVRLSKNRLFKEKFRARVAHNLSKSGATVHDGFHTLKNFVDDSVNRCSEFELIVLLGTNDLKEDESKINRDFYKKITLIGRKYFKTVYLCKILPSPKFDPEIVSIENKFINSFHSVKNIIIVDFFSSFLNDKSLFVKYFPSGRLDQVHWNRQGQNRAVAILSTIVV